MARQADRCESFDQHFCFGIMIAMRRIGSMGKAMGIPGLQVNCTYW